jgi:probable FeS assembly SUF system protein SufT
MGPSAPVTLKRDTPALEIPSGNPSTLPAGTAVRILQSLGGSYTVAGSLGGMYRVDAKDADALGFSAEAPAQAPVAATTGGFSEQKVWSQLKTIYDPEIPVNIVDLGLIYNVNFAPVSAESPEESKQDVTVEMTLTAQGCPEHVNISAQVKSRVEQLPGVGNCTVNVVWTPPWTPERLSPDAKKQLGIE